jgi:hypothetical protein
MVIKYLKHDEINKQKWDQCLLNSCNCLIYAFSYFLDVMAPGWEAIVVNDYEMILPLPVKKKWGIKYFYIPPFTSQLGLFGADPSINLNSILYLVESKVKYGDIFFNYANTINAGLVTARTNFVLGLRVGYESIYENYAADLKRILRKNVKNEMVYSRQSKIEFTVQLYQENYAYRTPHLSRQDYEKFITVCNLLNAKKMCFTRSMCAKDGSVLCSLICLADEKRIYTIINPSTETGRKKEAAIFLFDELIKEFSGMDVVLDFVGSDLNGVQFFLKKYSPINQPVFYYHYNNLPFPVKLLKT